MGGAGFQRTIHVDPQTPHSVRSLWHWVRPFYSCGRCTYFTPTYALGGKGVRKYGASFLSYINNLERQEEYHYLN